MRGSHVVTIIIVATLASGVLFLRNRIAAEEAAQRHYARAYRVASDAAKNTANTAKTNGAVAIAGDATATTTGAAATSVDPVRMSTRIVTLPRKKTLRWQVDLDGDGQKELLVGHQQDAAPDWLGGDTGAPEGKFELRSYDGRLLHKDTWKGYMHGVWRRAVKIGGNARVAMYQRSKPDDSDGEHVWVSLLAGRVRSKPFVMMPSQVIDVARDGSELLVMLSHELYQDFFAKGRMNVVRFNGAGWTTTLPTKVFEVCALDPGLGRPIAFAAVSRNAPHRLHVLGWNPKPMMYVSRQQFAVEAPEKESPFQIEQGFALNCAPSFSGGIDKLVQYKARRFSFKDARLAPVETDKKPD